MFSIFPIAIDQIHEDQLDCFTVEGFLKENFGPWKKGQAAILTFDLNKGEVSEFNDTGDLVSSVKLSPLKAG